MAIFNSYVSLPEGNHLNAHGRVQHQPNVDLVIENDGRCWHLTRNDGITWQSKRQLSSPILGSRNGWYFRPINHSGGLPETRGKSWWMVGGWPLILGQEWRLKKYYKRRFSTCQGSSHFGLNTISSFFLGHKATKTDFNDQQKKADVCWC
jgi:hypothetical protein